MLVVNITSNMQHNRHNAGCLGGEPVDYHFVRGMCDRNGNDVLCIQKMYKNHVMIYPPIYTILDRKDLYIPEVIMNLQNNSCRMIESFIKYTYLMSQHMKMVGYMPTDMDKNDDHIRGLSLHFLSSNITNFKLRANSSPYYVVMECTSKEPLFHLLKYVASIFINTPIYYNHNMMKSCNTIHMENASVEYT